MVDNKGQFVKGHIPWNKELKGIHLSPNTEFKKGQIAHNKTDWITKFCKCGTKFSKPPSQAVQEHCSRSCAKKGLPSWNKGKTASQETRKKQRLAKLGIRGEAHWNYRGYNNRTERQVAMSQDEYKQWRTAVFKRDDYTCQGCGIHGGYLEADHKQPWGLFPEERYNVDNGQTLCRPCHQLTPTWGGKTKVLEKVG